MPSPSQESKITFKPPGLPCLWLQQSPPWYLVQDLLDAWTSSQTKAAWPLFDLLQLEIRPGWAATALTPFGTASGLSLPNHSRSPKLLFSHGHVKRLGRRTKSGLHTPIAAFRLRFGRDSEQKHGHQDSPAVKLAIHDLSVPRPSCLP